MIGGQGVPQGWGMDEQEGMNRWIMNSMHSMDGGISRKLEGWMWEEIVRGRLVEEEGKGRIE